MNIEEELQRISMMDQTGAAMRNMAELVAVYLITLTANGVPHDSATDLTMPVIVKFLGGDPAE